MKNFFNIFLLGILPLFACQSNQLNSLNGRWFRPAEKEMFNRDTISYAEDFDDKLKSYTLWEVDGFYRYIYKDDTLLKRYPDTLHVNYEFNLSSDTSGEMYTYFLKESKELGPNEKLFLGGSTQFTIDQQDQIIEYIDQSGKEKQLNYRLLGEKLILDGEEFKRVR